MGWGGSVIIDELICNLQGFSMFDHCLGSNDLVSLPKSIGLELVLIKGDLSYQI